MTWREPILIVLASAWAASGAAQSRPAPSDQETLVQLERDWDEAFYRNDVAFIANVLADEFVATYEDGKRGDRAKELQLAAEFDQQHVSSRLSDFSVKVYGDAAVVGFTRHLAGTKDGRPLEVAFRFMDVFVWRAGRWQCVATQSTKIVP